MVPFFRVTESIFFGRRTEFSRRDLRPGSQVASVEQLADGRSVHVSFEWGNPRAGSLQETYTLMVRLGCCKSTFYHSELHCFATVGR